MNDVEVKHIDTAKAAEILGVSPATVRNWRRHGYLHVLPGTKLFDLQHVLDLKEEVESGRLARLGSRANKKKSSTTFLPLEYLENRREITRLEAVIETLKSAKCSLEEGLFVLTLNLFNVHGLLPGSGIKEMLLYLKLNKADIPLCRDLLDWHEALGGMAVYPQSLLNSELPLCDDILGIVYQSLYREGDKSRLGSYYTPAQVVDEIVGRFVDREQGAAQKILDPCCGTGQFLLRVAAQLSASGAHHPENLWGFDIDQMAVRIARFNLFLTFKDHPNYQPNVYCLNSLTGQQPHSGAVKVSLDFLKFDLIITNPPWGASYGADVKESLQGAFPEIVSRESFSYFLKKSLDLLKEDGFLSFILPESLLNVKVHRDIRSCILQQSNVLYVQAYERLFQNVFSKVIRLDLQKNGRGKREPGAVKVSAGELAYEIPQVRFLENSDHVFDVFQTEREREIINKVYGRKYTTLKNNAVWALGIVTGDNKKFISARQQEGYERIVTGREVKKYTLTTPFSGGVKYIRFAPLSFQQTAAEHIYRSREKLIYKFVCKDLVFAYDSTQLLTLNSANVVVPEIKGYPVKVIAALFNSSLYQFLYTKKFNAVKVLRGNLESLPLPLCGVKVMADIGVFIEKLFDGASQLEERQRIYHELDEYLFQFFSLTKEEITIIRRVVVNPGRFVV